MEMGLTEGKKRSPRTIVVAEASTCLISCDLTYATNLHLTSNFCLNSIHTVVLSTGNLTPAQR